MKKGLAIIASALLIALSSCGSTSTGESEQKYNIKELGFSSVKDVELKAGRKDTGYVLASVRDRDEFAPDDVIFVSENEEVATIEFTDDALTVYLYYDITGVGDGETYVYAKAAEGDAVSEKIRVVVEGGKVTAEVPASEPEETPEPEQAEPS